MRWEKSKIGSFLKRSKIPVDIQNDEEYKRVTIRINHNGVSVRDSEIGKKIGTKKQFILKSGQFVLSKIDARYGAFGIAPEEVEGAIITGNFWAYNVDFNKVNIEWFNQFTNSPQFYELCERASTGITHRKYLSETFFLNYEIDLPPVDEQLKLIDEIKSIKNHDSLLANELTHQLDLVKKLRQQLLQDAIQGKLVPQNPDDEPASVLLQKIKAEKEQLIKEKKLKKEKELTTIKSEEIPFDIPKNWVWSRLGDISEVKRGKGPIYSEMGVFKMLNQKCIRLYIVDNQFSKAIDEKWYKNLADDFIVQNNDVLVNSTGEGTIGRSAIADPIVDGFAFDSHILRIRSQINQKYVCHLINSDFGQSLVKKSKGATSTKQTELGVNNLSNFTIPIPPLSEQYRIIEKLDEGLQICDQLEASIKQSQQQNEQLLQQVLREALTEKAEAN